MPCEKDPREAFFGFDGLMLPVPVREWLHPSPRRVLSSLDDAKKALSSREYRTLKREVLGTAYAWRNKAVEEIVDLNILLLERTEHSLYASAWLYLDARLAQNPGVLTSNEMLGQYQDALFAATDPARKELRVGERLLRERRESATSSWRAPRRAR